MTNPSSPDDSILLVHAYVDGELDPVHALEAERRIAADPALAEERARIEALRRMIGERLPPEVPTGLVHRIEAAVGFPRGRAHPTWRALAASVVLAALASGAGTWFSLPPDAPDAAEMLVASHMRALMASQPTDVNSSDQHTVKPWFNGRITEAPRVVDLANEGFPLIGGRIDVIERIPVPTLVYRHQQHLISLTAIPSGGGRISASQGRSIAGYHVLTWTQDGVAYWAISDVGVVELNTFAKAFQTENPQP